MVDWHSKFKQMSDEELGSWVSVNAQPGSVASHLAQEEINRRLQDKIRKTIEELHGSVVSFNSVTEKYNERNLILGIAMFVIGVASLVASGVQIHLGSPATQLNYVQGQKDDALLKAVSIHDCLNYKKSKIFFLAQPTWDFNDRYQTDIYSNYLSDIVRLKQLDKTKGQDYIDAMVMMQRVNIMLDRFDNKTFASSNISTSSSIVLLLPASLAKDISESAKFVIDKYEDLGINENLCP